MKVVYISKPSFFDMDLSLVKALTNCAELHYILDIPPFLHKSTALDIELKREPGIYCSSEYKEFDQFQAYLGNAETHVINRVSNSSYHYTNIRLQSDVTRFIDSISPDIIHCNNFLDYNFVHFLWNNKRKIAITIHDPLPHSGDDSLRNTILRTFNKLFIKRHILLNSFQVEDYVRLNNKANIKVYLSRLGVYEYLRGYSASLNSRPHSVLFFGRISEYKGIQYLLDAFTNLSEEYPYLNLVIAGRGKYYFDISKYLNNPQITFINRYVDNQELVRLIEESMFVVCPYVDATQSGVIMSAYALNKPIIATNVGGIPYYVVHDETGILVSPKNVLELEGAMSRLLANPVIIKKMEDRISEYNTSGRLSWHRISIDLTIIYRQILNE